jgi:hypothetical protein
MAQAAEKHSPGVAGTKLVMKMAEKQDLDPQAYASTVMKSCFTGETSPEQFMAFLMIAREHGLNPITREIYAFSKGGKVMPIVSIDGWLKIINEHPQFDGMQFGSIRPRSPSIWTSARCPPSPGRSGRRACCDTRQPSRPRDTHSVSLASWTLTRPSAWIASKVMRP